MNTNKIPSKAPLPRLKKGKAHNLMDIDQMKYEKVSYRQKGKNKSGKIIKGNVVNSYSKIANPSVPSKFETQLFDNNQENKAFGSKSIRFFEYINEDPGPGSYTEEKSTSLMGKNKLSHSKKGFGNGFISKVKRFSSDIDFDGYFIPDPRAYSSSLPSTGDESQHENSTKKKIPENNSCVFKASGRADSQNKLSVPGPGSYNANLTMRRSLSQANPSSVFKSGVTKLKELQPKINVPPIGHYDVNSDIMLSKAESTFNILKRTSNFIDPLN